MLADSTRIVLFDGMKALGTAPTAPPLVRLDRCAAHRVTVGRQVFAALENMALSIRRRRRWRWILALG